MTASSHSWNRGDGRRYFADQFDAARGVFMSEGQEPGEGLIGPAPNLRVP